MKRKNKISSISEDKVIRRIFFYPNMKGVGHSYRNQLNFKTNPYTLNFIQNEIERMALINHLLVEIFLNERTKNSFSEDLDVALLKKIYPDKEIDQLNEEDRRDVWAELLLPNERDLMKALRNK